MSFGQNLLSLRKGKSLSQEELGERLNVSRQTISKWELDETTPELEKLILLSEFFSVSMDELVKGRDENENDTFELKITKTKKTTRDIMYLAIKVLGVIIGGLVLVDVIVMIIFFLTNGFPA